MTYHVKDLEAGPLLDQAVVRALGATHVQDCPEGVPDNVRERWPAEGAMVLTDEAGNMMFYGMRNIPGFSTEWGVGGPIIERERVASAWLAIGIGSQESKWCAWALDYDGDYRSGDAYIEEAGTSMVSHESKLVACLRALVRAKLGPTVDLFDPFAKFGAASAVQGPPR